MKLRSILRKLGLSAAALVAFVLAAELAARLAERGPMSLYDTSPYLEDTELLYVHEPGFRGRWDSTWYEINDQGWRGPQVEPTFAADEFRVVALGDSCTFGKGVLDADTWPRQLERVLREHMEPERHPVVFNLGVNGYSTWQYLRVLEQQALPLRPHLVVIGYNINDFPNPIRDADSAVFHDASATNAVRARLRAWLPKDLRDDLNRFALYRYLRATYYAWNRERDYAQMEAIARQRSALDVEGLDKAFEKEAEKLAQLIDAASTVEARVAIFLFPYESMVYLQDFDRGPELRVRSLADRLPIGFIDVPEAFRALAHTAEPPPTLFIRGDRYHPNARGYQLVAQAILEGLSSLGWLDPAH